MRDNKATNLNEFLWLNLNKNLSSVLSACEYENMKVQND